MMQKGEYVYRRAGFLLALTWAAHYCCGITSSAQEFLLALTWAGILLSNIILGAGVSFCTDEAGIPEKGKYPQKLRFSEHEHLRILFQDEGR